jgi:ATP-dependent exoDNAse (exonuclease V) alpha subunit
MFEPDAGDAMAIYRLSVVVVKRSEGRSAVAAAAYRSGTRLEDRRSGKVFDYRRKRVLHQRILAPFHAPAWIHDRERLWNTAEAAEKRKDAQLAREIHLALPHELDEVARAGLVERFVQEQFVSRGMVADIALHPPDRDGDGRNFHAHVLLSLRPIAGDGFGPKEREWNDEELLKQWRASWAMAVNAALEQAGEAARVDHRSLQAQGVDRVAQRHVGPAATELERRGQVSERAEEIRETQERHQLQLLELEQHDTDPPPVLEERWTASMMGHYRRQA